MKARSHLGLWATVAAGQLMLAGPATAQDRAADLILHNGKILTVDEAFSVAEAVVIDDGRIIAVGPEAIAHSYMATRTIDLQGRTALPGFMDTHFHPQSLSHRSVDGVSAGSIAELQDMIRAKAAEIGPGEWITGIGWDEAQLAERRKVLRSDLDAAAPENPVAILRAGGHSIAANSLALQAAGIDRNTPDPERGVIEHDADGEPNGIVRERINLFLELIPPDTPEQLRQGYLEDLRNLEKLGLTSLIIASASIRDEVDEKMRPEMFKVDLTFKDLQAIYREHGEDLPRASVEISYPGAEALKAYPHKTGYGDLRLRLGAIGEAPAVDGGFTGPTAWTKEDYNDQPGFRGQPFFKDDEDLFNLADDVAANGWQLGLHAIGDAGIEMAVRVYARVLEKRRMKDARWFLAHFTMLPSEQTMETMVRNNILAAAQPNFLYTLEDRYVQTLDGYRLQHVNPVGVPQKKGVFLAYGSDVLPTDPRVGLYAAVTRKGMSGAVYGPEEAVSIEDAIRGYTAHGPYLTFEEEQKGTLEVGKLADIIVLDRDPTAIAPEQLLTMNVDLTIIGGKIVYDRLACCQD